MSSKPPFGEAQGWVWGGGPESFLSTRVLTREMRCVYREKLVNLTLLQDQFFPSARLYEERQEDEGLMGDHQGGRKAKLQPLEREDRARRQLLY